MATNRLGEAGSEALAKAGLIADSQGTASDTPAPLRTVRRDRARRVSTWKRGVIGGSRRAQVTRGMIARGLRVNKD